MSRDTDLLLTRGVSLRIGDLTVVPMLLPFLNFEVSSDSEFRIAAPSCCENEQNWYDDSQIDLTCQYTGCQSESIST